MNAKLLIILFITSANWLTAQTLEPTPRFYTVYKTGTDKTKELSSFKQINLELIPEGDSLNPSFMNYQGWITGSDSSSVTITYIVREGINVHPAYEETSLLEVTAQGELMSATLSKDQIQSLWYEPRAKQTFSTIGKVCAFTGLIIAPLASIQLDGGFNTKRYYPIVGASAIGAGAAFGMYFLFNDRSFSFFPKKQVVTANP